MLDKRSRDALPSAPCPKPLALYSAENRTHIESVPFVGSARHIYITVLGRGTERVIDHVDDLLVWICMERDLIPAKSLRRFADRTLRPIDDEPLPLGGTCSWTCPYLEIR